MEEARRVIDRDTLEMMFMCFWFGYMAGALHYGADIESPNVGDSRPVAQDYFLLLLDTGVLDLLLEEASK